MEDLPQDAGSATEEPLLEANPVKYAKPSEWAAQKATIRRLYLDENKTLDEVKRKMLERHQFCATTSMYKKRIRAWGFGKKLKESEILEILRRKEENSPTGDAPATILVRGRVVKTERVRRYLERKPNALMRVRDDPKQSRAPGTHDVRGISPSVPGALPSPPDLRQLEKTMTAMRDYIRECGLGPNPRWRWTDEGYTSRNTTLVNLKASRLDMQHAIDQFYTLQSSIDKNRPPAIIFQQLDSTLNYLSGAIKAELPDFFFPMIEILRHEWSGHPVLFRVFRRHVQELAFAHLGQHHPMAILWSHMLGEQTVESTRVAGEVLEMLLQELAIGPGPQDDLTGLTLDYLLRMITLVGGPVLAARRFKQWMLTYPGWDDPSRWSGSIRSRLASYRCGIERPTGRWADFVKRPIDNNTQYQKSSNGALDYDGEFFMTYLAGRIASRLGDSERAEGWFIKAGEVARKTAGEMDYMEKVLHNLEVVYLATDRTEDHARVVAQLKALSLRDKTSSESGSATTD
ncbi:hypothetical protein F5Y15DRAFT_369202 [Xylariaceae sp. FL0016]|nr:hypothetical protein F5Y15DRAFT_369202 [Xylariaceae sp. FL0016]